LSIVEGLLLGRWDTAQAPGLPAEVQAQWVELASIFEEPDQSELISEADQE